MVTRRAVLKGTAAASIGAIAAAHGATPVAAAGEGYGQLEGGALGAFQKWRDAFQVSLKFHKVAADIFIKETVAGGVDVFFKFFHKEWFDGETQSLTRFPNLKSSEISFWKLDVGSAGIFIKQQDGLTALATVDVTTDGIFYKVEEKGFPDGDIG